MKTSMADVETAKLFKHGGSQAVRLPKAFRLPGTEVRVRRIGRGVLLEPMEFDVGAWRSALGRYKDVPFMEEGREQPPMPEDDVSFDR
jgi:antitoxin VapB